MHLKLLTKGRQATVQSRFSGSAQPTIHASVAEFFWPKLCKVIDMTLQQLNSRFNMSASSDLFRLNIFQEIALLQRTDFSEIEK